MRKSTHAAMTPTTKPEEVVGKEYAAPMAKTSTVPTTVKSANQLIVKREVVPEVEMDVEEWVKSKKSSDRKVLSREYAMSTQSVELSTISV